PLLGLLTPKRKTLGEKGIDCIFVGYAEHSKAYRFYVIEPNDSRDAIFDENRFSPIPIPKLRDQLDKFDHNTLTVILLRRIRRTYNEAMQSRDFALWKEAIEREDGF
ncbi:hypothetical protein Tco_1271806, partial [Tanacetum coccineum]